MDEILPTGVRETGLASGNPTPTVTKTSGRDLGTPGSSCVSGSGVPRILFRCRK